MKDKKYITVLDFEVGRVFQYEIPIILSELAIQNEDYEHYLTEKGHNLSNIEWMEHDIGELVDTKTSYGKLE